VTLYSRAAIELIRDGPHKLHKWQLVGDVWQNSLLAHENINGWSPHMYMYVDKIQYAKPCSLL